MDKKNGTDHPLEPMNAEPEEPDAPASGKGTKGDGTLDGKVEPKGEEKG